eukprot:g8858.t1
MERTRSFSKSHSFSFQSDTKIDVNSSVERSVSSPERKSRKSLHYSLYDPNVYKSVKKASRRSYIAAKEIFAEATKEILDSEGSDNVDMNNLSILAEKFGVMNPLNNSADLYKEEATASPILSDSRRKSINESLSEIKELSEKGNSAVDNALSLNDALESLEFETSAPHFRTTRPYSCLYKDEIFESNMKRTDLVDIFPFSFGYYYNGKFLEPLTDFCDLKLAKVHHKPMQLFLLISIVFLTLYIVYDVSNFKGQQLIYILIAKLGVMIPSLILLYQFTRTKYYWDNNIRQKVIVGMSIVVGLSITMYSFLSEGGSYGVFGLFLGIMIVFAPLHFRPCCIVTVVLWMMYLPAMNASERLRGTKWLQHWFYLGCMCVLYIFYRYKYLSFLQEDVLVSYTMVKQLKRAKHNKEISSLLLSSILPAKIIYRLYRGEKDFADPYDSVTVLFCEVCNFNKLTSLLQGRYGEKDGPRALVRVLNTIYTSFDDIIDEHFVHKVETVGEVYMVVGGAPKKSRYHACLATRMALSMINNIETIRMELRNIYGDDFAKKIDIHIGLNSGPIVAGVCGNKAPRYKLFGDTVNTASRMESTCPYGKVQASPSTVALYPPGVFIVKERGEIQKNLVGSELNLEIDDVHRVIDKRLDRYIETVNEYKPIGSQKTFRDLGSRKESLSGIMPRQSTNVGISRTGFAFGWRALWGKPYAPAICHRLSKNCTKRPSNEVIKGHALMERQFFDEYQDQYLKSFRIAVLVFIIGMCGSFYVDVQRRDEYTPTSQTDYCQSEFKTEELYCIKSYGYDQNPPSPLCQWDSADGICRNTINVTDHACMWLVTEGAAQNLETQLNQFIILRFAIGLPVGIFFLAFTFHSKAKEHLADEKCMRFQIVVPFIFYMCFGIALVLVSTLGGNPGHFTTVLGVTLLLNTSYLRLYLRIVWAIVYALIFPLSLYYLDFGYRRENYCFAPGTESIVVAQYVFYSIATILPPIIVRETYLRSGLFLKAEINESNKAYEAEDKRTTNMLLKLLPETIVHELKTREREIIADYFESVSIVFTDMKGFTAYSSQVTPLELVGFLNRMYNKFDLITDRTNLYKVEIIGDAYYCVGGCPIPSNDHAIKAAESALLMLVAIEDMKIEDPKLMEANVQIRIGVHTGPVIAAVVGVKDPRYHLFGDSVNYAMKMESNGVPGRVHCSNATVEAVKEHWAKKQSEITTFGFEERGLIDVKGYEEKQKTHFIVENTW